MRRAILWLDRNMGASLLALGVNAFIAFFVTGMRTNYDGPHPGRDFMVSFACGVVALGLIWLFVTVACPFIADQWGDLVRWAESPPRVRQYQYPSRVWNPPADPFLEAARREVNEIAPGDA